VSAGRRAGFTLVEILVAMSVLLVLGLMMVALMRSALATWNQAERQRRVYSRARAVFDCLQEDLESALTRDPPGSPVVARLFCQPDPKTDRQVLMLMRSFGWGAERTYTFRGDEGKDTAPPAPSDPKNPQPDVPQYYTSAGIVPGGPRGRPIALGGAAQVAYLHEGRALKRALCSPCMPEFKDIFPFAQPLADDVLYFEVLLATPYTTTWEEFTPAWARRPLLPSPKDPTDQLYGPERVWDSTRGILREFSFFVNPASAADGDDDVFPERVRITLVLEPDQLRTLRTDTLDQLDDSSGRVPVASTRGFPPAGTDASYILVDDEWMHYKAMDDRSFTVNRRGARGTVRAGHVQGSPVRCGTTFVRTFYLPGYRREDAAGVSAKALP
jgi:prepilin-type N-terminal cleavage/methylation domain-containing protein